jgi:myosin heavy subunit
MLAALESFRSDRLNAMVTVVQKNVRRRLAMKKYSQLRKATIKVQTWWRGVLARKFVESIRREVSAIRLQTVVRCFIQRNHFLDTRGRFILLQSRTWWSECIVIQISQFFRYSWQASTSTLYSREDFSCSHPPSKLTSRRVRSRTSSYQVKLIVRIGTSVVDSNPTYITSSIFNPASAVGLRVKNLRH